MSSSYPVPSLSFDSYLKQIDRVLSTRTNSIGPKSAWVIIRYSLNTSSSTSVLLPSQIPLFGDIGIYSEPGPTMIGPQADRILARFDANSFGEAEQLAVNWLQDQLKNLTQRWY